MKEKSVLIRPQELGGYIVREESEGGPWFIASAAACTTIGEAIEAAVEIITNTRETK
tara:strand:+ start:434 stop:604 length:171 start_codon:yes stop_codon:yes gene_type:complete